MNHRKCGHDTIIGKNATALSEVKIRNTAEYDHYNTLQPALPMHTYYVPTFLEINFNM